MSNYYVIFRGEVAEGFEVDEVKKNLASILEEDDEAIEDLFSGRTLVIKRDPSLSQCQKLRDVFLAIGAVCHIRDSEGQAEHDISDDHPQDSGLDEVPQPTPAETAGPGITEKLSTLSQQSKEKFKRYWYIISEYWKEAVESIKTDFEAGGIKNLSKNKYFISAVGIFLFLVLSLSVGLLGEKKAMPINEKNFTVIVNHIDFIEKAFTIEELRTMTEDPRDFLDYLLADPIKKMGYQFDATIENIADSFLHDEFTSGELQKVKTYLEITAHERAKLLEHGFISERLKMKLEAVSKKMGK